MIDCMRQTVQQEGFFGLYRGFVTGVIGTTHGAVQIAAYSWMIDKRCAARGLPKDTFLVSNKVYSKVDIEFSEPNRLRCCLLLFQNSCHYSHVSLSSSSNQNARSQH